MELTEVLILSLVQGITEWLPISSDGHLFLFEHWFDIKEASLSFDVFLHLASLVVILFFFRRQIIEIIRAPFDKQEHSKKNWWWLIVVSNIFTAGIGYFLYQRMDSFRNINSVTDWMIITSIFLLASKFTKGEKTIGWKQAIILGIVQGLAVLPGWSRSGSVIAMALILKIKKTQAFEYGFIMVIPAIVGSFILTVKDFSFEAIYILAFVATAIISYLSLALLKFIMKRDYFYLFFIYTLLLSLIVKLT
ncbi:MAG: undecaprenyl-diphosphate phosphatase [Patescibacteria group bacterium]|jgi:undecaprenyl-diphosphatase